MADDNVDDAYDDLVDVDYFSEEGFSDYVPTTIDPSPWVLLVCSCLCLLLVFLLPLGVAVIQRKRRRASHKKVLEAGFVMKQARSKDQVEDQVQSSANIETVLDSHLVIKSLDSKEEKLVRSSTTITLDRNDVVLALCRPNMENESDPLTRFLEKEMESEQFENTPVENSSPFVQDDASSSTGVELAWKPAGTKIEDENQSGECFQSHGDIKTKKSGNGMYALIQTDSGNIKVQCIESKEKNSKLKELFDQVTSRSQMNCPIAEEPTLHSVSELGANSEKLELLLPANENPLIEIDDDLPVISQPQPLARPSSSSEVRWPQIDATLCGESSFEDTPYYLCTDVPSMMCGNDNTQDTIPPQCSTMYGDDEEVVVHDAKKVLPFQKAKKFSVYPDLAKRAVRYITSRSERRRNSRSERRRKSEYRENTKRQKAMENLLYDIYGNRGPTVSVNVIPNSETTTQVSGVSGSILQKSESESIEDDGSESDSSSSTASEMTEITLSDLKVSDIPLEDIMSLQYDEDDTDPSAQMVAGWQKGYDYKTETEYYYNLATGERSTDCPIDPVHSKHQIDYGLFGSSSNRPWICYFCSSGFFRKVFKCLRFDDEMQKILKLAGPYTSISVLNCIFSAIEVAIVGRVLGTNALSAYFAVGYTIDLGTIFLCGVMEALHVTCSQAIGAENYKLAGQYLQLSVWIHQLYYIPFMVCFWNRFDDIILWLGFNDETAESALWYARYAMVYDFATIFHDTILSLLDVNDQENYSAILSSLQGAFSCFGLLIFVNIYDSVQLWMIAVYHTLVMICFFLINIIIVLRMGWLEDYWRGLIGSNPLSMSWDNLKAFKSQALPLSIGYIIEYGEWEVLFIFAATTGPAEMAVWGLLGEIWSLAEEVGGAVTAASEVRVAKLLGAGKPKLAKYSAEKSMCIGLIVSCFMAALVLSLHSMIPTWLTNDKTLQSMLEELLPLVCLGVAVLAVGTTSWSILCAQGRSHLSTSVSAIGSVFVSLPLAFVSTFGFNFNLEGLVASLIVGYSIAGFFNSLFLMSSNWEKISEKMSKGTKKKRKKQPVDIEMVNTINA